MGTQTTSWQYTILLKISSEYIVGRSSPCGGKGDFARYLSVTKSKWHFCFSTESIGNAELEIVNPEITEELGKILVLRTVNCF